MYAKLYYCICLLLDGEGMMVASIHIAHQIYGKSRCKRTYKDSCIRECCYKFPKTGHCPSAGRVITSKEVNYQRVCPTLIQHLSLPSKESSRNCFIHVCIHVFTRVFNPYKYGKLTILVTNGYLAWLDFSVHFWFKMTPTVLQILRLLVQLKLRLIVIRVAHNFDWTLYRCIKLFDILILLA